MYMEGMVSDMKAPHVMEGESFPFPLLCYNWIEFLVFVLMGYRTSATYSRKQKVSAVVCNSVTIFYQVSKGDKAKHKK